MDEQPPLALRQHGTDAVSFQALESGLHWWHDLPAPDGTGATLAFADTGRAWIGVGSPLIAPGLRARAARRFFAAARAAGRRGALFGVEDITPFDTPLNTAFDTAFDRAGPRYGGVAPPRAEPDDRPFRRLAVGRQSMLFPSRWPDSLRAKPRLREQLRRARAKGVLVRRLTAADLAEGTAIRRRVEQLRDLWLGSRRMEPLQFLVSVEPFHCPHEHIYLAAERQGRIIQFLSAVPIYARRGWLLEDMLRSPEAPNGTTELLIDHLLHEAQRDAARAIPSTALPNATVRDAALRSAAVHRVVPDGTALHGTALDGTARALQTAADSAVHHARSDDDRPAAPRAGAGVATELTEVFVTPGLTPLAGPIPWWLRLARYATRPLYDFAGLERFRARLAPPRWDSVWLVWDRGPAPLALLDLLDAFAAGALPRFAWRTLVRHPSASPWALALPLVPWTALLALLTVTGQAGLLGFSTRALAGWVAFDAALAWLLFRAAHRPHPMRLAVAAACAGIDALLSVRHLQQVGLTAAASVSAASASAVAAPTAASTAVSAAAGSAGVAASSVGVAAVIFAPLLRLMATAAPIAGCAALIWAVRKAMAAKSAG